MDYVIIFLTLAVTVLTICLERKKKWSRLSLPSKALYLLGLSLAVTVAINSILNIIEDERIKRIKATVGEINGRTNYNAPSIMFGYGGAVLSYTGQGPFLASGMNEFSLLVENEKLIFTGLIYNLDGKIVAAVERNEWKVYNNEFEYNDDDNGLEIVNNGTREVLFQISLEDGVAHILGTLVDKYGNGFILEEAPNKTGGLLNLVISGKTKVPITQPIKQIFKYPRETHIGERVK